MEAAENATSCGPLEVIFEHSKSLVELRSPAAVVLQASPALVTLVVWVLVEGIRCNRRGVRSARSIRAFRMFRGVALALGVAGAAALGTLTWRCFDLLACDEAISLLDGWKCVAVVVAPVTYLALLLAALWWPSIVRLLVVVLLALAGGTVVADWSLRGGYIVTRAAEPLVAVQQLWCLHAVILLSLMPTANRRRLVQSTRSHRKEIMLMVDPLAVRHKGGWKEETPIRGEDRSWSWFW